MNRSAVKLRAIEVPAGDAGAADADLPRYADRDRLQGGVEQVDARDRESARPTCSPRRLSTSAREIGRYVTWTVVSVIPYMFTSLGLESPYRSNQGRRLWRSSASPPKIT